MKLLILVLLVLMVAMGCGKSPLPEPVDRTHATDAWRFSGGDWMSEYLRPKLRVADVTDYNKWFDGFIKGGGKYIKSSDNFNHFGDWYVTIADSIEFRPLFGANAINIIVAKGVRFVTIGDINTFGGWGHCGVYWMDGFKRNDESNVVALFYDQEKLRRGK